MDAVHRYEGTVNQVMGDGIMALFGAPLAHEDHAVRACYAALAMQEAIRRYTDEVRRLHGIEIQLRVGLNSGEVVVRTIGNDLRMDYSAVGQTTHLAARMEQLATPGTTRLTGETLRLAEGFVQVVSIGPIPVKGLSSPVEVFELAGAGGDAHAAAGVSRPRTDPVRGTRAELEHLRQALDKARRGQGQVVAVVGDPGVGKSRLLWEFIHSHHTARLARARVELRLLWQGHRVPPRHRSAAELLPDREPGRCARHPRKGHRQAPDARRVVSARCVPAFLTLLERAERRCGVGCARSRPAPAADRRRPSGACCSARARSSRCCVVFEDLHWVDAETQALLDALVESLPTARDPAARQLPARVPPWLGKQDLLQPAPPRPAAARERRRAPRSLLGDDDAPRAAQAAADEAHRGQPVLPRGERAHARGDGRADRRARSLCAGATPRHDPGPRHRAGHPRRADRSPRAGRQDAAPDGGRHRQGRAVRAAPRDRRR